MRNALRKYFFPVLVLLLAVLSSCQRQNERQFKKSSLLMDTLVTITVAADSEAQADSAIEAAFQEIRRLERLMSFWSEESEIAAIYGNAELRPVKVSSDTLDLIEKSLFISEKTGGAFDATVGPVIRLWDFKKKKRPDKAMLEHALSLVDWRAMVVDRAASTAFLKKKGMSFDTGGILKGYAADKAVEALKRAGIKAGLVAVAGDIRGFGADGKGWRIGIRDPRPKEGDKDGILATIELRDEAISTSGDYERFFIEEGVRYHHLLDPKTGYPAEGFMSVSVIAKEGVFADGFSTGIFVMGPGKGPKLLGEAGLEAVTVDGEGKVYVSDGLKDRVRVLKASRSE